MLFTALSLAALAAPLQESALRFDTAQVVLEAHDPFVKRLLQIDGDGVPDAIGLRIDYGGAGSPDRTYLGIYFGDGSGHLVKQWTLTVSGPFPSLDNPIVAGDFDGDGKRDDFATTLADGLYVFLCEGRNQPLAQPPVMLTSTTPVDLEVADIDGDGRDDLVAIGEHGFASGALDVVLAPADWATATSTSTTLAYEPFAMTLARLGGDLHAAVVHSTGSPQYQVVVDVFDVAGASPSLAGSHVLPTPSFTWTDHGLGGGDIDGDGDDDVVAFGDGAYYVLRSTGASFVVEPSAIGGPATDLFDIDQDGDLDGVCCGGGSDPGPSLATWVSAWEISLNDGTGTFAPARAIGGIGGRGWAGADDVDGDGDLDLVAGRSVYFDRGEHYALPFDGLIGYPATVGGGLGTGSFADADGDGDIDMNVALQSGVLPTYYQNDGAGGMTFTTCPTSGFPSNWAGPYSAGAGDFDADGDLDVVMGFYLTPGVRTTYFTENVAGTFVYRSTPTTAAVDSVYAGSKALAFDWDRDGNLDLVQGVGSVDWPAFSIADLKVWLGDGAGDFVAGPVHANTWLLDRADFDGDGLDDFLVAHVSGLGVRPGLATGGWGAFAPLPTVIKPEGEVAVADLDGDGDLDLAAFEIDGETPVLFENDGSGAFTAHSGFLPHQDRLQNSFTLGFDATDFDGDGLLDLVIFPGPTAFYAAKLYRNVSAGTPAFELDMVQYLTNTQFHDLDLDGDDDLAGRSFHRSLRIDAVQGGASLQFGAGTAGSGGFMPKFGVSQALDSGKWVRFHASGVKGGLTSVLAFGLVPAELPGFPAAGVTAFLDPALATTIYFPMPGAPIEGEGKLNLPFFAPPGIAGLTFYHQLFVIDPGAVGGIAATGALRLTYGMP